MNHVVVRMINKREKKMIQSNMLVSAHKNEFNEQKMFDAEMIFKYLIPL